MLRIKDPKVSLPFYTDVSSSTLIICSPLLVLPSSSLHDQIIGMDVIESEQIRPFAFMTGSPDTFHKTLSPKL
jgi:hypothetical protein